MLCRAGGANINKIPTRKFTGRGIAFITVPETPGYRQSTRLEDNRVKLKKEIDYKKAT
jgi:hypothetical protein